MNSGYGQIVQGLVVGGIGFPIVSAVIGAVVNVLTSRKVKFTTATRLVFVALGVGVAGSATSGRISLAEAVACLFAQVVAWSVLVGPGKNKKNKRRR